jgi:hypothetical protein
MEATRQPFQSPLEGISTRAAKQSSLRDLRRAVFWFWKPAGRTARIPTLAQESERVLDLRGVVAARRHDDDYRRSVCGPARLHCTL